MSKRTQKDSGEESHTRCSIRDPNVRASTASKNPGENQIWKSITSEFMEWAASKNGETCWRRLLIKLLRDESHSEKVGSSDATSNALQNTEKEQWRNPPQYWETQDKICLCCWCRRKRETKARRSWTRTSSRSHQRKRDEIYNSLQSCAQIHSDVSSIKNCRFKGSSGEKWEKLEKIPALQLTKVGNKKEVIEEVRTKGRKVQFVSLMDLYHLANSELEPRHQKYKGRVVLRGDIVKDDSSASAVCTKQGSSASQMTAAKVMDIISRLRGCAADAVSLLIHRSKWKMLKLLKIRKSECPDVRIRLPKHKWPNHGPVWKTQSLLWKGICTVTLWQDCYWKGNLRKSYWSTVGRRFPFGNAYTYTVKKGFSYLCMWMT